MRGQKPVVKPMDSELPLTVIALSLINPSNHFFIKSSLQTKNNLLLIDVLIPHPSVANNHHNFKFSHYSLPDRMILKTIGTSRFSSNIIKSHNASLLIRLSLHLNNSSEDHIISVLPVSPPMMPITQVPGSVVLLLVVTPVSRMVRQPGSSP